MPVAAGWCSSAISRPQGLADLIQKTERAELIRRALVAKGMQKISATAEVVAACEELARK